MALSQFTYYTSSDASAPALSGTVGSLLTLLDAVLVNGYGSKTAAGWTKPFANSGNIGCYKQGAGALFGVVVNDNGPNVTSTFKEAWVTGWEVIAGIGAPVGTGNGQFPMPAQQLTTGHLVWRKSASADAVSRPWMIYADASTFYLFMFNGDAANTAYHAVCFGDIYSLAGVSDLWRCILIGGGTENSAAQASIGSGSALATTVTPGGYMPRGFGGGGLSIQATRVTDAAFILGTNAGMVGDMQTPNSADNALYLGPIRVCESSAVALRGRLRGVFVVLHPPANFTDGQIFSGANDFAGKTFRVVKGLISEGVGAATVAMETSNTVETN